RSLGRRGLPSFPTRRSSDLVEQQAPATASNGDWLEPASKGQLWRIVTAGITATPSDLLANEIELVGNAGGGSFAAQLRAAQLDRSEEHTSELQSRRDLVCRL